MKVLRNFSFETDKRNKTKILLSHFLVLGAFFYLSFPSFCQSLRGKASYYSNNLQGRRTASGEKYDKNKYTAAHQSYPFGTKLKITHTANGKTTVVTVNDRGPFSNLRLIDLSYAAAKELDLLTCGIGNVSIEVLDHVDSIQSIDSQTNNTHIEGYYIPNLNAQVTTLNGFLLQTGAFRKEEDAYFQISNFEKWYIGTPYIHITRIDEEIIYEVVYAGFETKMAAMDLQCTLIEKEIESVIIELK
jgi:rare lipoprotein A